MIALAAVEAVREGSAWLILLAVASVVMVGVAAVLLIAGED